MTREADSRTDPTGESQACAAVGVDAMALLLRGGGCGSPSRRSVAPKRSARLESQSQVSITITAASDPQILLLLDAKCDV